MSEASIFVIVHENFVDEDKKFARNAAKEEKMRQKPRIDNCRSIDG